MRRTLVVFAIVLGCLGLSTGADAATLTLTSAGNSIYNGVFMGPYTVTDQNGNVFDVICDDFVADSYLNETWSVDVHTGDLTGTRFASPSDSYNGVTGAEGYSMIAWLGQQLFADPGNADIQYALWHVFSSNAQPLSAAALTLLNTAYSDHRNDSIANLVIYTPTGTSCLSGPCPTWPPQEFIAIKTPEPGTLSLIGMGLATVVASRRRRRVA